MSTERNQAVAAFLAGAAVGSLLGVLFAPASGKETRERITRTVRNSKDDLDELIEKGRAEWSKAKGKATMTKDEVSDFVRFLFAEGWDLKDRLRDDVTDSADEVADRARKAADRVRHSSN